MWLWPRFKNLKRIQFNYDISSTIPLAPIQVLNSTRLWHHSTWDQTTPTQRPGLFKSFISLFTGHSFPALPESFQGEVPSFYLSTPLAAAEVSRFHFTRASLESDCSCSTWLARFGVTLLGRSHFWACCDSLIVFLKGARHPEACGLCFKRH